MPASAIELGEIEVHSTLGQPLRASIAYALGTNEQLAGYCINLNPANAGDGLPAVTRAGISVANGVIALTGAQVVREPLMSLRVNVNCPYTPSISREYMLFIDPPAAAPQAAAATANSTANSQPGTAASTTAAAAGTASPREERAATRPAARRVPVVTAPVSSTERYFVQRGDTLSEIAARIENRPVGLWDAVAQIFAANPQAFIDNDPNKLMADVWLDIPEFGTGRSYAVSTPAPAAGASAVAVDAAEATPYEAVASGASIDAGDSVVAETGVTETAALVGGADGTAMGDDAGNTAVVDDASVLEPANPAAMSDPRVTEAGLDSENPFVGLDAPDVVIPDTELPAPETASGSPNVATARVSIPAPQPDAPASTNWLLWLVGGGVALILGLLLFGRRNRKVFDPQPLRPAAADPKPPADELPIGADSAAALRSARDDEPTMENPALDADLVIGSGLQESGMHVNEDFGFATESNLDLELPDDSEQSVNVDATRIQANEEVTERDLTAVLADGQHVGDATDNYTVSQEIDYQILAQDYEDEMTATQALNIEIEKAAAQIAKSMDQSEKDDLTAELQLATVTELELAAREPANDSDGDTDGDTDGEQRTATGEILSLGDSLTLVMPNEDNTDRLPAEEDTVQRPRDDNTVEMPRKTRSK